MILVLRVAAGRRRYCVADLPARRYLPLVRFVFDIRKSIAATAYLCSLNRGRLNVLHLIKMLYAADRTALVKWHRTITGDRFVSMKHGPVLSRVYDLMQGRATGRDMEAWSLVFSPRDGNVISLKAPPDLGPLSEREIALLQKAFVTFRHVPAGKLIAFLHNVLPEWQDPGDSSAPIDPRAILLQAGLSEDDISEIHRDLDFFQSAKLALQAV